MSIEISIEQLRKATEIIFRHVDESGRGTVNLDVDYYWFIPKEQRHDPYKEPEQLTLGQLSDDWRELQGIADGTREPIGYALTWLAAVATAIGERAVE